MSRSLTIPTLPILSVLTVFVLALAPASAQEVAPPPPDASKQEAPKPIERNGTFVPAHGFEVKLELESYQGPFELVEVVAHGTPVREGDVIARLKLDAIDDQIEAADRDLRSTEVRHQNSREQTRLDVEGGESRLEDANEGLALAERTLAAFEKTELEIKRRSNDLSASYGKDNVEDQKDELAQLEKMYTADELTDATEEIVLKRSRRQLARTETSNEIQESRRRFDSDFAEQEQRRQKQEAVKDARRNRDRLVRQLDMEKRSREDTLARLDPEMKSARDRVDDLRRDREKLVLRAPRSGTLLHGALDDYRPGKTAARHDVGGSVGAKVKIFTIASPGEFAVAVDVPESLVLKLANGVAVKVVPAADEDGAMAGRLRFDRFPSPRSASAPENTYDGTVELDQTPPALVPGMRCKVLIDAPDKGELQGGSASGNGSKSGSGV